MALRHTKSHVLLFDGYFVSVRFFLKIVVTISCFHVIGIHQVQALNEGRDTISEQELNDTLVRAVPAASLHAPSVYIDCRRCDFDFIRTELNFVNYVRDPKLADVHVFVTDEQTAGGGREYQFTFIGRRRFQGTSYTLNHYIDRNATLAERREALKRFLKLGFASYLLQTPLGTNFTIEYHPGEEEEKTKVKDPWDYWVFQGYVGRVRIQLESNQSDFDSRWGIFADRVTEDWKIRIRPYFNYGKVSIQTFESDEPVVQEQRRHGLDSYVIKSLTGHWSTGLFLTYYTNNGNNIRHRISVSPGIEYSIFPYEQATRRAITFTYQLGYQYNEYFEETIYDKVHENLYNHRFRGIVNVQQPWGTIETGAIASQFWHDLQRYRIEFYGFTSVRLFEGFALRFQIDYNVIRDQLSLPKGEASLEDVLLKRRELSTDFSFTSSVAITYTFGSRFTNIVNTRF